jgi:cyclopropane fatty-acyl-phospholipid synthase-like methyltransferase
VSIKNNGSDFPGVPPSSVDYIFSFGVFVHLERHLIEAYLASMREILAPGGMVVLQYSDKTKIMGQINKNFAQNDPEQMRSMIGAAGYTIRQEDTTSLWHSDMVRFSLETLDDRVG